MHSSPQRVHPVAGLKRGNSPQDESAVADLRCERWTILKAAPAPTKTAAFQQPAVTLHRGGGFLFYARTPNHAPKAIKKTTQSWRVLGALSAYAHEPAQQ